MKQRRILLVGGSGYLGTHLRPYFLSLGCQVWSTGTGTREEDNYIRVDFREEATFLSLAGKEFDLIIVLASKLDAMGISSLKHPDLETNTLGYGRFLEFLAENQVGKRLLYISSMSVYSSKNTSPVLETDELSPLHTYGLSKVMAENITSFFCQRNEMRGVIFRLPGIYGGDRKSGFIYSTIQKLLKNEEVVLETKKLGYWETIHVDDLCEIICEFIQAYKWPNTIDVFNLGYGEKTDFYGTALHIGAMLNRQDLIVQESNKGYVPFHMSNEKVATVITIKSRFYNSLDRYIKMVCA